MRVDSVANENRTRVESRYIHEIGSGEGELNTEALHRNDAKQIVMCGVTLARQQRHVLALYRREKLGQHRDADPTHQR